MRIRHEFYQLILLCKRSLKNAFLRLLVSPRNKHWIKFRAKILRERLLTQKAGIVSIVVPFRDVESFLGSLLTSLRNQTYPYIEILLIDDGSQDDSVSIVKKFVDLDDRFLLVQHDRSRGPGAARNTGAAAATGDYLLFVDGDDLVPLTAVYRMLEAISISGSDFVLGGVQRLQGHRIIGLPWSELVHGQDRYSLTLEDFPQALLNPFCWGKLFKRDFYNSAVRIIPEGVYYEDQVPSALAYTAARSFDVLASTTYYWRIRQDGSSITQNRGNLKSLEDRITAIHGVSRILGAHSTQHVHDYWLRDLILEAMRPFDEAYYNTTDDQFRAKLRELYLYLLEQLPSELKTESEQSRLAEIKAIVKDEVGR